MTFASASPRVDNIRHSLVGLKMPRALEMLDATLRRIEQGEIAAIEAIDDLLTEELTLRENRRVKAALRMARLPILKTLAGFDFSFQPSLARNRIMALAGLDFINRAEVIHLRGPPGTGKSHLATALAVEAVRAGKSVYFIPLAEILSGSAVQTKGLGSSLVSPRKRLMAAWRSTIEQNTPRLRRRLANLAKKPSTALSQEAEVGV